MDNNLVIKNLRDCFECNSFFGYKDGKQYTDSYDTIEDLKEENKEFNKCIVEFKNNANVLLKVTDSKNLLNDDVIEKLKKCDETIYWNNANCYHYVFDFRIGDTWFESTCINNELTVIELNAFK